MLQQAILTCPACARAQDHQMKEVSCLGDDAILWTDPHLIRALHEYITVMKTSFPLEMIPNDFPTPSPPH